MGTQRISVSAYPLQWPKGVPRTKSGDRRSAQFGKQKWPALLAGLDAELSRLGVAYRTISSNLPLRQDGKPYSPEGKMDDPGVAVYFQMDGEQVCFPCDQWSTVEHNIRAITLHIESIRGQQRWGVGTAKQAFAGYRALTSVAGEGEGWWTVLGLSRSASVDEIKSMHRDLARRFHPDLGGTPEQMTRINTARDRALAEKAVRNA